MSACLGMLLKNLFHTKQHHMMTKKSYVEGSLSRTITIKLLCLMNPNALVHLNVFICVILPNVRPLWNHRTLRWHVITHMNVLFMLLDCNSLNLMQETLNLNVSPWRKRSSHIRRATAVATTSVHRFVTIYSNFTFVHHMFIFVSC